MQTKKSSYGSKILTLCHYYYKSHGIVIELRISIKFI